MRMITVDLNELDLNEFTAVDDPSQHCKAAFPLIGAHGSQDIATVYIELEPGDNLGRHTDSAEELLVVLEGELLVTIGVNSATISKGSLALVPKMAPHDLKNTGSGKAKILGVFGGTNNIVATFERQWLPTQSYVVDTAQLA